MIKYILTDIEGTTSSISFVHEILFPYSQKFIAKFIDDNFKNIDVQTALASVKQTVQEETKEEIDDEEAILTLKDWIIKDRKHKALKDLQGMIWKSGYEKGDFKGHVYPEVKTCLENWKKNGLTLGVYSSGSVPAQKLLFTYSEAGDLTPLFSHYFDTSVGHKREENSYHNIQKALGIQASEILFLSDIIEELDAAKAAGMQTIQLDRKNELQETRHPLVKNFSEIKF